MSRGLAVDDGQLTKLMNISASGLGKLGLRPTLLDVDRVPRGQRVARQRWLSEQAAQTAVEGATATQDTGAPDDRHRTAAE
jgi:hypothetical protein